ncbi:MULTISPECIES: Arm DNA-binding domain-containing protein [unclassified Adlercreutzia]|uniref:Arm DNA-binding domain-containing protein n=1 Tax=unclassified Adlercreutzia TaxID=2636013 RepID=UPI0013EA5B46|nr:MULTISPECIES: Arm DNA-binding domain-containing protein [unclassified Adlercreutzia]
MTVREMPNGTFTVQFRCKDKEGNEQHKFRRGFETVEAAAAWEADYKATRGQSMAMTFSSFLYIYHEDLGPRICETCRGIAPGAWK